MVRRLDGRNGEIWRLHSAGMTQSELAQQYGISQQRVSEIIIQAKAAVPERTRQAVTAEILESLDMIRVEMTRLAQADPVPVTAGKDAAPVPAFEEDGTLSESRYAEDHSGRIEAMRTLAQVTAQMSKLLGLNQPDKVQSDTTIHYVIEGVDTDKL